MKKNLNQDDFESFLQQAADGHKIYPTDRVWQAIDKKMEHQRKWPALRFASALLVTIVMGVLFYAQPDKNELHSFTSKKPVAHTTRANNAKPQFETPASPLHKKPLVSNADAFMTTEGLDDARLSEDAVPFENSFSASVNTGSTFAATRASEVLDNSLRSGSEPNLEANLFTSYSGAAAISELAPAVESRLSPVENAWQPTPEIMVNSAKAARAWRTQLYVTPSVSYRFINETGFGAVPLAFGSGTQSKLKDLVTHKPLFGLEAGVAFVKPVTSNFNFRIGVQANYRAFEIEGWNSAPSAATINIRNSTTGFNTISTVSNVSGTRQASLRNTYLQVAAPIGFDVAVTRSKRVNVFVGASLQPTYTVAQKAHVLSSDYEHYVQQPDLMRRFTMNNSAELGLRVKGKKLQYQAGPQIRYQLTPTTKKEYSIRENLIDYGFKIGISKTN